MKKAHFIAIWGIGISAVARYYHALWYTISGSDGADSPLIHTLRDEGMDIHIGHHADHLPADAEIVIYSEAIITRSMTEKAQSLAENPELARARELGIRHLSYPEALAEIVNAKKCIAVAGSHGKSTTTAMLGIMLAGSAVGGSTIVGTQVPQLGGSNFYFEDAPYFAIEACEYRRSFLKYFPSISIITNIDLDHLDYYRDLPDYMSAFEAFQGQTSDYMILNGLCENSRRLRHPELVSGSHRSPGDAEINSAWHPVPKQLWVYENYYVDEHGNHINFPDFTLQIPGKHIEFDAKMVYVVGRLLGLSEDYIIQKLESYAGCWRRSEIIRETQHGNILMSDYGHHPSEIAPTLAAIKEKYPSKKLCVAFQPHQHSRTRELIDGFTTCFDAADTLIIPDIYRSRDSDADVAAMTTEHLVKRLSENYPHIINGHGLDKSLEIIKSFDESHPNAAIIILLGAGSIDSLRDQIL